MRTEEAMPSESGIEDDGLPTRRDILVSMFKSVAIGVGVGLLSHDCALKRQAKFLNENPRLDREQIRQIKQNDKETAIETTVIATGVDSIRRFIVGFNRMFPS